MANRLGSQAQAEHQEEKSTDALRRRLVKGGAAVVPFIVSLQSGTAWALSSCASNISRPSNGNMTSTFGPPGSPNSSQQENRDFVESVTGISDADIATALSNFTPGSGNYPKEGGVQAAEIMHLLVTNGSCWVSYCGGPVSGTNDVTITDDTTPSSCT